MARPGTYVYCLIAADRRPVLRRRFPRLPGMGPVRLLEVDRRLWLAVADAPLDRYGEETINRKLSDLDWVSRAAIAHEAVVESFIGQRAVAADEAVHDFHQRRSRARTGPRRQAAGRRDREACRESDRMGRSRDTSPVRPRLRGKPARRQAALSQRGRTARGRQARATSHRKRPSVMRPWNWPSVPGKP